MQHQTLLCIHLRDFVASCFAAFAGAEPMFRNWRPYDILGLPREWLAPQTI